MKKDKHPPYQDVLFVDSASGHRFVCGSTLQTKATGEFEGKTYPRYDLSISSHSHPYFTGEKRAVDSEGRVDRFNKRFGAKAAPVAVAQAEAPVKAAAKPAAKTAPAKAVKKAPTPKKK